MSGPPPGHDRSRSIYTFFLLILLNQTKISCIIHQNWFNMNYESLNWCTGGEVLLPTAHKDEHAICIYGIQNWVRGRGRGGGNSVHLHYVSPVRSAVERDTWSGTPLVVVSVMPWHWPVELGHSHILLNKGHAMLNHYNLHLHDGVWNLITILRVCVIARRYIILPYVAINSLIIYFLYGQTYILLCLFFICLLDHYPLTEKFLIYGEER